MELAKEAQRQEENDKLRKEFAKHANAFHQLLTDTRWGKNFLSKQLALIFGIDIVKGTHFRNLFKLINLVLISA